MYIFHAAKYGQYDYPNWNDLNSLCDFGPKLYFSTDIYSAEEYSQQRCQSHDIVRVSVPETLLRFSTVEGLSIINYSYNGSVFICNDDECSQEEWSMGYDDCIKWTRQVLANRKNMLHMLAPNEFANIMIGPRADSNVGQYLREINLTESDFNDASFLMEVFEELRPSVLDLQIAFDYTAFDTLIGKFTGEDWTDGTNNF